MREQMSVSSETVQEIVDCLNAKDHTIRVLRYKVERMKEAMLKCRVALTPHVFIDDDARRARDLDDDNIRLAALPESEVLKMLEDSTHEG